MCIRDRVYAGDGETVLYDTGRMNVSAEVDSVIYDAAYHTMSDFSS